MKSIIGFILTLSIFLAIAATSAFACTRAVYQGPDGLIITGRSMDWRDEIPANLWLFPRGMQRHGNAIFEYVDGKLVIHHDMSHTVMTNSPIFEQQLALNAYWEQIGGLTMLPGTNRAADRFVRASFYINAIPRTSDAKVAVASVFSVIRNASVPFGISSETEPNISSTRWRSVSDQKNLVYYFETALTPNTFWVDLKQVNFAKGEPVKRLRVANHEVYAGDALSSFKVAEPFVFAGL